MIQFNAKLALQQLKAPAVLFSSSPAPFAPPQASFVSQDSIKLSKLTSTPLRGLFSPTQLFQSSTNKTQPEHLEIKGLPVTIHWEQRSQMKNTRIPVGYGRIQRGLPEGLSQVASYILNQGNPLGTYTPFTLNGKDFIALNEYHSHYADPVKEAARRKSGQSQIYAITVFQKL